MTSVQTPAPATSPSEPRPVGLEGPVVDAARRRDPAAWDYIYHRFGPALTRYAASRGVPDPEDVTQDVMCAAAARIDRFAGGEDDLRSWLFTIAYRRCADHHRRRHRRPEVTTERPPEHVQPHEGADADMWAAGEGREAFAALDILTQRERDVVTLRIIGELGTGDVADMLGLSTVNVRVIQSRALAKLRRHLEGNGGFLDRRFRSASVLAAITTSKLGGTLSSSDRLGSWVAALRGGAPPAHPDTASLTARMGLAATSAGSNAGVTLTALARVSVATVVVAGTMIGALDAPPRLEDPGPAAAAGVTDTGHPGASFGGGEPVAAAAGDRVADLPVPVANLPSASGSAEATPAPEAVIAVEAGALSVIPPGTGALVADGTAVPTAPPDPVQAVAEQVGASASEAPTLDPEAIGLPTEATSALIPDEAVGEGSVDDLPGSADEGGDQGLISALPGA